MGRTEPPGAVWAAVSVSGCSDRRHPWVGGGGSLGLRGAVGVAPRAVPTWDPALVWGWGVGRGCEEPLGDPPPSQRPSEAPCGPALWAGGCCCCCCR